MKETSILLLTVLLTGTLVNSTGFVFAQTNSTSPSNSTSSTVDTSSIGNFGKYISELVHKRNADFKQQRVETIEAINDCREDIKNTDSKEDKIDAQESCKATLKEIREKYKAEREEYRQLFKEYRNEMKALIKEAKGQTISEEQKEKAMNNLDKIKETHEKIKQERQSVKDKNEN